MAKGKKINVGKKPLPPKPIEEEEDDIISAISEDAEDDMEDFDSDDMYLAEDAEEKLDDYLEGAPAIVHSDLAPAEVNEDYPSNNHVYCRVKASKTHKEIAPENNHTLIIRQKN